MEEAFGGSDAEGRWSWKLAYEACEAAQVLFLRRYGAALVKRPGGARALLAAIQRLADLLPTQTRRSEDGQAFLQFSTPLPLGIVAAAAARITPGDVLLEPSNPRQPAAPTGLHAVCPRPYYPAPGWTRYRDAAWPSCGFAEGQHPFTRRDRTRV